jgi:type II secretory pathway pseudopilin PulG
MRRDDTLAPEAATSNDSGFFMVALRVGMSIAAIYMTAALPAWRQQAQRLKEAELVFRGEQYARAIMLYQDTNQGVSPPNIDILVSQRYLRKKWKDPVTGKDFCIQGPGVVSNCLVAGVQGPVQPGGAPRPPTSGSPVQQGQQPGITGVRSESTATSIKVYEGQQAYNMWPFDANRARTRLGRSVPQQPGRGGQPAGGRPGGPGTGQPGRSGGPGGQPGRGGDGVPIRPGGGPPPQTGGPVRPGGAAGS